MMRLFSLIHGGKRLEMIKGNRSKHVTTAADVAARAGVSQASVSLVLSGKWERRVSAETAALIRRAADELSYRPNFAARRLRTGEIDAILFLVPVISNPFFAQVHEAIVSSAGAKGVTALVYPLKAQDDGKYLRATGHGVDGIIACSLEPEEIRAYAANLPVVLIDGNPSGPHVWVNADIQAGVAQAVSDIAHAGFHEIHHLAADRQSWTFKERARVVASNCEARGMKYLPSLGPPTLNHTLERARDLIAQTSAPIAFICDTEQMALGVYMAAMFLRRSIPSQVALVSFDDGLISPMLEPALTAIRIDAAELGRLAYEKLHALQEGRTVSSVMIDAPLIRRGSIPVSQVARSL